MESIQIISQIIEKRNLHYDINIELVCYGIVLNWDGDAETDTFCNYNF